MRANLDLTGGLLLAERVVGALAPALGRQRADELVTAAAEEVSDGKRSFDEALLERPEVAEHLGRDGGRAAPGPRRLSGQRRRVHRPRARCADATRIGRIVSPGGRRASRRRGPADAPVLVLSNSLGSTLEMWDPQMAALTPHLRVIRYDLRGHGASPVPPPPYDDRGSRRRRRSRSSTRWASIVRTSAACRSAAWSACGSPPTRRERVDRLVLCCTSPRFEPPEAWAARAATVLAEGTGAVADAVVARWFTPAFADEFPALVREMRDMIARTPAEGYAACCGVVERTDLRPSLPSIEAPTLVIAGADDPAAPPEQGRADRGR